MADGAKIDPDLLEGFRVESQAILVDLEEIVAELEGVEAGQFPAELLRDFSQKIDRIMGAAKTFAMMMPDSIALQRIGKLAELCKFLGYKAADQGNARLLPIFAAFWGDVVATIDDLLRSLEDEEACSRIVGDFVPVLEKRLAWLATKVLAGAAKGAALDTQALVESLKK